VKRGEKENSPYAPEWPFPDSPRKGGEKSKVFGRGGRRAPLREEGSAEGKGKKIYHRPKDANYSQIPLRGWRWGENKEYCTDKGTSRETSMQPSPIYPYSERQESLFSRQGPKKGKICTLLGRREKRNNR